MKVIGRVFFRFLLGFSHLPHATTGGGFCYLSSGSPSSSHGVVVIIVLLLNSSVRVGFLLLSLSSILGYERLCLFSTSTSAAAAAAAAAATTRYCHPFTGNAGRRMSILFK